MTKKNEHDVATGKIIVRDMTVEELAQYEKDSAKWAKLEADQKKIDIEKAVARLALLDRLGLTEQEAQLLLGS